jgi:hypothetical protein
MSEDKVFVNGMIVKKNEQSPEWVVCGLSFKVDDMKAFLDQHNNAGWVNVQVKKSQGGKIYAELDTWKPQGQAPQQQAPQQNFQPQPNQTYQTENVQPPPFNQAPPNFQQGAPIPQQFQQ